MEDRSKSLGRSSLASSILRRTFALLHRYVGLALAAFLVIEGLTGSLLAFNMQLERLISPQLFATPKAGARRLSLGELAERAEALAPDGQVDYLFTYPNQTMVRMEPRPVPSMKYRRPIGFTQLFLDPWTGKELGRRDFGNLAQGSINIMPFVYNVHSELALGPNGEVVLGVVALIWTIDCFVAFYLTLPPVRREFWRRWGLAWKVKRNVGAFRLNFDLHRAGGLWLWPMLFVFAWSSVMLALPSVYERVMGALFDYRSETSMLTFAPHSSLRPGLDWISAERVGAQLLAEQGKLRGFKVVAEPDTLAYIPEESVYSYGARTTLDIRGETSDTAVWFDADSGAFRYLFLPSREHAGNTVGTWLWAMHFADLGDKPAYHAFVCIVGLVIVLLAVTGVYIWLKKRSARRFHVRRSVL